MKSLKNASLIKGVFRELAILGIQVSVADEGGTDTVFVSLSSDHASKQGKQPFIQILGSRQYSRPIELKFRIDDDLYVANLSPSNEGENFFDLPPEVLITNQRVKSRIAAIDYGRSEMIGELRGFGWRRFGTVKDFSETWLSVQIEPPGIPVGPNDQIAVRVYSDSKEVFVAQCFVGALRLVGPSHLIVLKLDQNRTEQRPSKEPRLHTRQSLQNSATLDVQWPDKHGVTVSFSVIDCGLGGFRGKIVGNPADIPPVGAIVSAAGSSVRLRIAWQMGTELGFDARINDRFHFNEWLALSSRWKNDTFANHAPKTATRRIVSSLLRSGYLSGEKANNFLEHPSKEALVPQDAVNARWLRRFARSSGRQLSEHVSFLRLTDASWLIQELGNASEARGIADQLITDGLIDLTLKEEAFLSTTSVLVALYSSNIPFNKKFWSSKAKNLSLRELTTYVGSLRPDWYANGPFENARRFSCVDPTAANWRQDYRDLETALPYEGLASVGMTADGFTSPQLSRDLFDSGHILKRRTTLLMDDGKVAGVAVIFGLPTYANLTVSANHLWLVVNDFQAVNRAISSIKESRTHSDLLLGVTQIVAITAEPDFQPASTDPWTSRSFKTLAIPFSRIIEFCNHGRK